jgi:hypothetical protein
VSQPQEIIVYRNPVEYQLYNSELVFPLMVAAVVAVVVTVLVGKVQSYFTGNFTRSVYRAYRAEKNGPLARLWSDIRNHFGQYLCLYAGAIAAVATFVKMTNV